MNKVHVKTEKFSSGYINEMAYVLLAYGLICASEEVFDKKCASDGVTPRSIGYREDKKITRRLSTLRDELLTFIRKHGELQLVVEAKKQRLFNAIVSYTQSNTPILEYLVCYILYLRFQEHERTKPLHVHFAWLSDKDGTLFQIIDLMNTKYGDREMDMFKIAAKIAKEL